MSCIRCDLSKLLEQTRPPDPELVDPIELAFIEGQIDSQKVELAYLFLTSEKRSIQAVAMDRLH